MILDECLANFKQCLEAPGYPKQDIKRPLSEVKFDQRQLALKQKQKSKERLLPFITTYHPAVQDLKKDIDGKLKSDRKSASAGNNF